eukprot:jgi/Botrbrau1/2258/Bobra.101_2s0082.1
MWVVENLQEELLSANDARLLADHQLPGLRQELESLQEQLQEAVVAREEVEEQIGVLEMHLAELRHRRGQAVEAYQRSSEDLGKLHDRTAELDQEVAAKSSQMNALQQQAARLKQKEGEKAGGKRPGPASAGPQSRSLPDLGSDSDGSHVSSTWGTDSGSEDDDDPHLQKAVQPVEPLAGVTVTQVLQPPPDPFMSPATRPSAPSSLASSSTWLRGVFNKPQEDDGG